jgi:hypothetical protein
VVTRQIIPPYAPKARLMANCPAKFKPNRHDQRIASLQRFQLREEHQDLFRGFEFRSVVGMQKEESIALARKHSGEDTTSESDASLHVMLDAARSIGPSSYVLLHLLLVPLPYILIATQQPYARSTLTPTHVHTNLKCRRNVAVSSAMSSASGDWLNC